MSTKSLNEILANVRGFCKSAEAKAQYKQGQVGGESSPGTGTPPGAEKDKPVPAGSKDGQPETKQEIPPGGKSSDGATDAEKVESGQATPATKAPDQAVEKKPLVTGEAVTVKPAAADTLANDLLSKVRAYQQKAAQMPPQLAAALGKNEAVPPPPPPPAKDEPKKDEPKKDEAKKDEPKKDEPKKDEPKKDEKAAAETLDLSQEILAKIAAVMLSTEEGVDFCERQLAKAAGAEAARETMETLHAMANDQEKQAAATAGSADAAVLLDEMAKGAGAPCDDETLIKLGQALALEALKQAQAAGMDLAAMGAPPSAAAGAEMPADTGADQDISPDELEQILNELVQSGEIKSEEADQILEYVSGAGQAGAGPEAGGGAGGGSEDGKTASAEQIKQAAHEAVKAKILATVKEARAAESATKTAAAKK